MKIKTGLIPDFADYDEIDQDVLDAVSDFDNGVIGFDELKREIGEDAAYEVRSRSSEEEVPDHWDLLDNPDDL